ncbi:MAG: hypothetical protein HKM93_18790 [Desulfobacteraceae bacterium]|nr:hypothetical protein [Desulfobacteraceae bacterium]
MINFLLILFSALIIGCSQDEHQSYVPIDNILKPGGPAINYDPNSSYTNIDEIQKSLSDKESEIFNKSLSWYGTESIFKLERMHNKSAKEVVDIVNCLKISELSNQEKCFK